MKVLCAVLSFILSNSLVECQHESGRRIPAGVYEESSGQEKVTVKDKTLLFHVRAQGGPRPGEILEAEYSYELLTDGRIHVSSASSDVEFIEGIMPYHWFWNGNEIIRKAVELTRDKNGNMATTLGPPVPFVRRDSQN
jgi:hypothetical protein